MWLQGTGSILMNSAVRTYAVGDAKRWDRPLDAPLKEGIEPHAAGGAV